MLFPVQVLQSKTKAKNTLRKLETYVKTNLFKSMYIKIVNRFNSNVIGYILTLSCVFYSDKRDLTISSAEV